MWALPDTVVEKKATATSLYPESYGSRMWGRRKVPYYTTKRAAATHINAVCRGFLARLHLSQYFGMRYAKILCQYSGYYYYYDRYETDTEKDPSWHKPRLAFPWDIGVYVPDDPEDYLHGDKYSYRGFEFGPYVIKNGVGQQATQRAETHAFIKPNEWRDSALERPEDIDVDENPLGSVIAWMDGLQIKDLLISEYVIMVSACVRCYRVVWWVLSDGCCRVLILCSLCGAMFSENEYSQEQLEGGVQADEQIPAEPALSVVRAVSVCHHQRTSLGGGFSALGCAYHLQSLPGYYFSLEQ
jgi:hypothetical protein